MSRLLERAEIDTQVSDLPGWSFADDALHAAAKLPTFPIAIDAVAQIADEAESMNHHPDIDIRYTRLVFKLSTHDAGGVTQLDIELAHRISQIVNRLGGTTEAV